MKRIEIGVIDPRAEQAKLLMWAARVDAGESLPEAAATLNFASFQQLRDTFTEPRMELLRTVARHEGVDINQLALEARRNGDSLRDDVRLLCELGLLEQQDGKLFAPFDEVVLHYSLREAA